MFNKRLLIGCLTVTLPLTTAGYPAPREPELPHKAHGYFGIGIAYSKTKQGMAIEFVHPNSPAALFGMRSGDIILAIDGRPLDWNPYQALERMAACRPGSNVPLRIDRDGKHQTIVVRPGYLNPSMNAKADYHVQSNDRSTGVIEGVGEEFLQ
jgi:C-terminal processing protease CtpA/Prc